MDETAPSMNRQQQQYHHHLHARKVSGIHQVPATMSFLDPGRVRQATLVNRIMSSTSMLANGQAFEDDEQDILRHLLGMESTSSTSLNMQPIQYHRRSGAIQQASARPFTDFHAASRWGEGPRWSAENKCFAEAVPVDLAKVAISAEPSSPSVLPVKKPHECEICHKQFRARSELITHERIHTGHKPFKCMYEGCTKRFAHSSNLGAHHKAHQGIKPYVCMHEGCEKRYAHSGSLKEHVWKHYGVKPFKCSHPDCDRTFTQRSNFSRHMKKCHGVENKESSSTSTGAMSALTTTSCPSSPEMKHELNYM
ncbi:hypothetical protein H310_05361 [Aphanomyces invadans]|uniref:C2H2-type domain-containing protein n=1 Tax=Aphanomyces invadans TaxID=157072 RepID=A0A024U9P5_9STRA|nr:hypothetical protein H310_05361 [Aphanomyces invadans]ETW02895.1 hypothetical protein H310_05361 [Aphanomyces invadans]|eukprot:XP_008868279.1 hypothetical protein H310_05361 [Aphanomyces invadans]